MGSQIPIEDFHYDPLPTPTSIRLVQFAGRDPSGHPQVKLKTVDLEDNPSYHALSYTWGNPHPALDQVRDTYETYSRQYPPEYREPILVDGKRLGVSRGAYEALTFVPKDAFAKRCDRRDPRKHLRGPLHWASMLGNASRVEQLIAAGVDVNVQDENGITPLSYAAAHGFNETVELLLSAGADASIAHNKGLTPVDVAREAEHQDIVELLQGVGRDGISTSGRELWPDGPQAWCWIDQICIDQSNLAERSSQVSLMGRIYSSAFFTLVWLGPEDPYTEMALRTVLKLYSSRGDLIHADKIKPYRRQDDHIYASADIPYVSFDE